MSSTAATETSTTTPSIYDDADFRKELMNLALFEGANTPEKVKEIQEAEEKDELKYGKCSVTNLYNKRHKFDGVVQFPDGNFYRNDNDKNFVRVPDGEADLYKSGQKPWVSPSGDMFKVVGDPVKLTEEEIQIVKLSQKLSKSPKQTLSPKTLKGNEVEYANGEIWRPNYVNGKIVWWPWGADGTRMEVVPPSLKTGKKKTPLRSTTSFGKYNVDTRTLGLDDNIWKVTKDYKNNLTWKPVDFKPSLKKGEPTIKAKEYADQPEGSVIKKGIDGNYWKTDKTGKNTWVWSSIGPNAPADLNDEIYENSIATNIEDYKKYKRWYDSYDTDDYSNPDKNTKIAIPTLSELDDFEKDDILKYQRKLIEKKEDLKKYEELQRNKQSTSPKIRSLIELGKEREKQPDEVKDRTKEQELRRKAIIKQREANAAAETAAKQRADAAQRRKDAAQTVLEETLEDVPAFLAKATEGSSGGRRRRPSPSQSRRKLPSWF